jgi:hypothetical protein
MPPQYGRLAGLELWGTARREHAALIRELGATPIDYQREDFTRALPGGLDVVFDGLAEDGNRRSFARSSAAACSAPRIRRSGSHRRGRARPSHGRPIRSADIRSW